MNKKKIASLIMSAVFITGIGGAMSTGITAAAADTATATSTSVKVAGLAIEKTKIDKEEATKLVISAFKKYFEFELNEKDFQCNINLNPDYSLNKSYIWSMNWNSNNINMNTYLFASIDANTGKIYNLSKQESDNSGVMKAKLPEYTQEQCKKVAEEFIGKINPEAFNNVKLNENSMDIMNYGNMLGYDFRGTRLVNGISYANNYVHVQVDSTTGKVISYDGRWDENIVFPSAANVVDSKKVLDTFKNNMNFELQYYTFYNNRLPYQDNPVTVKLVYMPTFTSSSAIDANTGAFTQLDQISGQIKKINITDKEKEALLGKYPSLASSDKEISKDKAEQVIKDIIKELIGDEYEIDSVSYQNNNYDQVSRSTWSAQVRKGTDPMSGGYIGIDSFTAEITNFSLNNFYGMNNEVFTPKLTWEEAYKKAIDVAAKYYSLKFKDTDTEQVFYDSKYFVDGKEYMNPNYNFNFVRKVNGIKYNSNAIMIAIDSKTGNIGNVNLNWDNKVVFPNVTKVLSKDEIAKCYYDIYAPTLSYTLVNSSQDYKNPKMELKLVYSLKAPNTEDLYQMNVLDANSGKMLDMSGNEVKDQLGNLAEKIKGSKYEKQIMYLAKQQIIDSKDFALDKKITKLDFIKALVGVKGYRIYQGPTTSELKFKDINKDDVNYRLLQLAVSGGIIKNEAVEFKGNSNVTREEMYKMIVASTQYSKLAESPEIFTLNFNDIKQISTENFGYIAIAKGLSIIDTDSKDFAPKENVTIEELAHAIFNSIQYMTSRY